MKQERLKELVEYEDGRLYWLSSNNQVQIGDPLGEVDTSLYLRCTIDNKHYLVHRLIFLYHYGYLPKYVDHINRVKLDNRIENLRAASAKMNALNRTPNQRVLPKGVYKKVNKYVVILNVEGKTKNFGSFETPEEASNKHKEVYNALYSEYI